MNALEITMEDGKEPVVDGLPGPHSKLWKAIWTPEMLLDAFAIVGVDAKTAKAVVEIYPEERIREQLRALYTRHVRISKALTLVEAIKTRRPCDRWLRLDPGPPPVQSDYAGPFSNAKHWSATQTDINKLLSKHGADGLQWGTNERLRRAAILFEKAIDDDDVQRLFKVRIDFQLPEDVGERNAAFRALYHHLKSKFDVLAFRFTDGSALIDFEREFRAHIAAGLGVDVPAIAAVSDTLALAGETTPQFDAAFAPEPLTSPAGDLTISESSDPTRIRLRGIDRLLEQFLRSVGVAAETAEDLVRRHRDRCEAQLAALPFRKVRDRAAYLVRAIENDLPIPERIANSIRRSCDERALAALPAGARFRGEIIAEDMLSEAENVGLPGMLRDQFRRSIVMELATA